MEAIFHEQQDGSLCAQHCLNSLLQGQFYSAVDLADLASELDTMERLRMAEVGEDTPEYRQFMQQPSVNMDDSGFFSVQVISRALSVWALELVPLQSSSPAAVRAKNSPIAASAYICNFREHWFTVRRLGSQWFNLNSLLEGPELVSNTYLGEFLAQLQQEGYDIFLITGDLPPCDADLVLQAVPAVQAQPPRLLSDVNSSGADKAARSKAGAGAGGSQRDEAADLEAAMLLSLAGTSGPGGAPANIDSAELARVMEMQRQSQGGGEDEMMEMALRMSENQHLHHQQSAVSEEDEIQKAIALSLEGGVGGGAAAGGGGSVGARQEGGGWGARLMEQEVEEEEKWLLDQERARQEEEEQLRRALMMSMEAESGKDKTTGDRKEEREVKVQPKPQLDPVHTGWPTMKNPPPGTLAAGPSKPASTSAPPTRTSVSNPASTSASTQAPTIPSDPGHRLGEAGGASQPRAEDPQEIRRRRMAFLDKLQKSPTSDQSKQ